jgi:glycogen debranching enzyme
MTSEEDPATVHPVEVADPAGTRPGHYTSPFGDVYEPLPDAGWGPGGAEAPVATHQLLLSVKEGETFVCSDHSGDLTVPNTVGMGIYFRDTRFLSRFELRINGAEPVLLSSSAERAHLSYVDLTNPDLWQGEVLAVPAQTVNIRRIRAVADCVLERMRVKNFNHFPVEVSLEFALAADYLDLFEVRGLLRERRGTRFAPIVDGAVVKLAYLGVDQSLRETWATFSGTPAHVSVDGDTVRVRFDFALGAQVTQTLSVSFEPIVDGERRRCDDFTTVFTRTRSSYEEWEQESSQIRTDNEVFDALALRGIRDLRALLTKTRLGEFLAAGIPWYVAPFGRDAILASYEILAINPEPARRTLHLLGSLLGTQNDPWRDEEPGKVLHEIRQGELANADYIPHTPYYGTIDATPLYLMLAAAYFRWTNDLATILELKDVFDRALAWIDRYGDLDGDGYVEYIRRSPRGLRNQGWKDSGNAIVHADGTLAAPPIALAEVQGYVYMAKRRMAEIYALLGEGRTASRLERESADLKVRFNRDFWVEDEQYFALALDGEKRQVTTVTTNPAHGLYCDLIDRSKAKAMAQRLMAPDMFSGWGIRTMSKQAVAYNPMSYHNGSVWPHDNAIVAAGLKRYGYGESTLRITTALFEAAMHMEYFRLPELFCGFTRRSPATPVRYPVACSPQAWAAASPFLLLQSMLGISARADQGLLTVNKPDLPDWLNRVEWRNLRVGDCRLSLVFTRQGGMTTFSMTDRQGDVRVLMEE